jgi:hypothetical protein
MNLDDVVRTVKSLQFSVGSYIVYGSGPLALHGVRSVNDVDMLVTKELKTQLKSLGWKEVNKGPNDTPVTNGVVEAHDTWSFCEYSPALNELLNRADTYKGVSFASLEDVLKWKLASPASDKNLKDIQSIKDKLSENSST